MAIWGEQLVLQTSQKAHLTISSVLLHLTSKEYPPFPVFFKGKVCPLLFALSQSDLNTWAITIFSSSCPAWAPHQHLFLLLPVFENRCLDLSGPVLISSIKGYCIIYHLQRQFKVTFHPFSLWAIINETCIFNVMVLLTTTFETVRMTVCKIIQLCFCSLPCEIESQCRKSWSFVTSLWAEALLFWN